MCTGYSGNFLQIVVISGSFTFNFGVTSSSRVWVMLLNLKNFICYGLQSLIQLLDLECVKDHLPHVTMKYLSTRQKKLLKFVCEFF